MPDDNVVLLNCLTTLDLPPDRLLEAAVGELDKVIIIGVDKEGCEYYHQSTQDIPKLLFMIEKYKKMLMDIASG